MIKPSILQIIGDFLDTYQSGLSDSARRDQTYTVRNTEAMTEFLVKAHEHCNNVPIFEYSLNKNYIIAPTRIVVQYCIHLLHEECDSIAAEEAQS